MPSSLKSTQNSAKRITFFRSPSAFRKWLEQNHADAQELWVGFYRKDSGRPSITWPESVDEALCFGWIDGLRKRIDSESYMIRFTRRRAISYWSIINIGRVEELRRAGRMHPAAFKTFEQHSRSDREPIPTKIASEVNWTSAPRSRCVRRRPHGNSFRRKRLPIASSRRGG